MIKPVHVSGENRGHIMLYALSTCGWCKKTKQFLDDLKVEYYYLDVDLMMGEDRDVTVNEIREMNPKCSFPTLVINNEKCIVGFREDEIREAINK